MAENRLTPKRSLLNIANAIVAFPIVIVVHVYRFFSPLKKYLLGPTAGCRFAAYLLGLCTGMPATIPSPYRSLEKHPSNSPMQPSSLGWL